MSRGAARGGLPAGPVTARPGAGRLDAGERYGRSGGGIRICGAAGAFRAHAAKSAVVYALRCFRKKSGKDRQGRRGPRRQALLRLVAGVRGLTRRSGEGCRAAAAAAGPVGEAYFSAAWMTFSALAMRCIRASDGVLSSTSAQQAASSPSKMVFSISSMLMPSARSSPSTLARTPTRL